MSEIVLDESSTDSISVEALREECRNLEVAVLARKCATKEDLEPHRPGNMLNFDTGSRGWLRFFAVLHRHHGRFDDQSGKDDMDGVSEQDRIVLAALQNAPITVRLYGPELPGSPVNREVRVYPKSFSALINLSDRDHALGWLADKRERLKESSDPKHLDYVYQTGVELTYLKAIMIWAVTSPTVKLPWDDNEFRPTPPEWILGMDVIDVHRILRAHVEVNSLRLQAIEALISGLPNDATHKSRLRPSWSVFFGNASKTLGVSSSTLMRDWSFAEVLAQLRLSSAAERDAMASANEGS